MPKKETEPIIHQVMIEQNQGHETRKKLYFELERVFDRPIVSFFTSFTYPVMIEDTDADMLEGLIQKMDLSKGIVFFISSPGGDGLAAERIINVLRSYSGSSDYWVIVPGKAKSAATMVCFGSSKIIMGATSELGPIDPQVAISIGDSVKRYSAYNIVESYNELFENAVKEKDGNLQPYLQQLANYDARDIKEFRAALSLSEDIAIRSLQSGMMAGISGDKIKEKIKIFLSPEQTKTHGRPIYRDEAESCGLIIDKVNVHDKNWQMVYDLYIRLNNFVSTKAFKCIESKNKSFIAEARGGKK